MLSTTMFVEYLADNIFSHSETLVNETSLTEASLVTVLTNIEFELMRLTLDNVIILSLSPRINSDEEVVIMLLSSTSSITRLDVTIVMLGSPKLKSLKFEFLIVTVDISAMIGLDSL